MVNRLPQEAKAPLLFSISVLRGVRHFVRMLTYEHSLLLIWVERSLVQLRFLGALYFVLRCQGDALPKVFLLEVLKVQTTHRNPSFQTRWEGSFHVELCTHIMIKHSEHLGSSRKWCKQRSFHQHMVVCPFSSERREEQLPQEWKGTPSVSSRTVITENVPWDQLLHNKILFLERHKKKSLCNSPG